MICTASQRDRSGRGIPRMINTAKNAQTLGVVIVSTLTRTHLTIDAQPSRNEISCSLRNHQRKEVLTPYQRRLLERSLVFGTLPGTRGEAVRSMQGSSCMRSYWKKYVVHGERLRRMIIMSKNIVVGKRPRHVCHSKLFALLATGTLLLGAALPAARPKDLPTPNPPERMRS